MNSSEIDRDDIHIAADPDPPLMLPLRPNSARLTIIVLLRSGSSLWLNPISSTGGKQSAPGQKPNDRYGAETGLSAITADPVEAAATGPRIGDSGSYRKSTLASLHA